MEDNNKPKKENDSNSEMQKIITPASYEISEEWVQEHIKQFGEEPSFF